MITYHLFTDGSIISNVGGWGYLLETLTVVKTRNGIYKTKRPGDVELLAIIKGLKELEEKSIVYVFTDSFLVINGANFRRFKGLLWEEFYDLLDKHHVTFIKVGKNNFHPKHKIAHNLAREAVL